MTVGIVILSRFNSTRLPGKARMKIAGKTVLEIITDRLVQVVPRDAIVIATSAENSDNPISDWAKENDFNCYRGSLENVADRFYQVAKVNSWQYATRINGDNVFVDINLLREMLTLARTGQFDFISNVKGRTFPKGMSVEIVRVDYYASLLEQINKSEAYREHVTSYLYEHENDKRHFYVYNNDLPEASGIQMALDTPEDLERTRKIIERFTDAHWKYNLKEIYSIWKQLEI